ncbi:hypothetical protein TrST_g6847 [Triparma strigata]|uniref:Peptidase C1A papain C-terminal domain-containing protein n=1 Tax=Triparma strigata TaxID=1606541 RepID=A0A9W7DTE4_9STRA|nr:hypothetical protein TrST_g6847 [Triparma strigata]
MKLSIAAIIGCASLASALIPDSTYNYEEYVETFKKKASSSSRQLFEMRLGEALAHNSQEPKPSYLKGINEFSDIETPPMGRKVTPGLKGKNNAGSYKPQMAFEDLPTTVDWRDAGVVSPVKNQGGCGSCYAFATTATVESHIALSTGLLFDLSPQQVVACAPNDDHCGGFGGCMGSIPELVYDYLIEAGGYAEEWSFPYVSYDGQTNGTCKSGDDLLVKAGITGYVKLEPNNAQDVMTALAEIGPLAVNVDASNWHNYESGVFIYESYDDMDLNHVVVLVGYGTDEDTGLDYWLVRNSWSPTFGEAGYIRLLRDPVDDTPCGVDNSPQDGTGCDGEGTQYPCGSCGVVFDVSYPTGAFIA